MNQNFCRLMSDFTAIFYHMTKIMTEFTSIWILDDHVDNSRWISGHKIISSDQPMRKMRFSTIIFDFQRYETQRYGIKSITNWIWFEIALIYWKPLFDCKWSQFWEFFTSKKHAFGSTRSIWPFWPIFDAWSSLSGVSSGRYHQPIAYGLVYRLK